MGQRAETTAQSRGRLYFIDEKTAAKCNVSLFLWELQKEGVWGTQPNEQGDREV